MAFAMGIPLLTFPVAAQIADATASAGTSRYQLDEAQRKLKAGAELKQQEHQRILGVIPDFNTSNVQDAEPLSAGQKWHLALKSAIDPFTFVAAGIDAGLNQATDDHAGYGQGAEGYGKRLGASYADSFSGTMLGNALFPMLLHQDPRYFRKGSGSFSSRLMHALAATVICRNDNGKLAPNYSNLLGNLAAGGISNLYYPPDERGAGLTFDRALTVSAEGTIGTVFVEFWPDISKKLSPKGHGKDVP